MTMRITEAELARDVGAVLDKVQQGSEVVIEREDQRTVAIVSAPPRGGRPIDDILRDARARNSTITLDEDFGRDMEEIIAMRYRGCTPPSGD